MTASDAMFIQDAAPPAYCYTNTGYTNIVPHDYSSTKQSSAPMVRPSSPLTDSSSLSSGWTSSSSSSSSSYSAYSSPSQQQEPNLEGALVPYYAKPSSHVDDSYYRAPYTLSTLDKSSSRSSCLSSPTSPTKLVPYNAKSNELDLLSMMNIPTSDNVNGADAVNPSKRSLKKSRKVKTAVGTVSGAVIGGVTLGPVGAVVGAGVGAVATKKIHKAIERKKQRQYEQQCYQNHAQMVGRKLHNRATFV